MWGFPRRAQRVSSPKVGSVRIQPKERTMSPKRAVPFLAALAGAAALALGTPVAAVAGAPEPVTIETHGVFTGPDSTAGTFTISGALSDSGSYVDSFRLAGETIH